VGHGDMNMIMKALSISEDIIWIGIAITILMITALYHITVAIKRFMTTILRLLERYKWGN